ncbi:MULTISPECIES: DUF397 domain-containing protein [Nocardiopsidaceae]|uniref:DUF397 domain-containing protein n=2 Tax=Nocardiopsidaceae TaxID=83676 RepID=A0ABY6YHZ2_9ACTN|nr:DUF397 domain-containing protein [Streptomonospora nanhaiensis]MEE2045239.1 DUF397 domain-containing protein [Nocardiopsis tropica]WAE71846.1 DUF397 domain-containing protein [Streptomonospora nanhaiensis]
MNAWHKSTYSESGSHCVEAREHESGADVRDARNREAGFLSFPADEWRVFLGCSQAARRRV